MSEASNFQFLKEHDSVFFLLTHNAERIFPIDPNAAMVKLRQFGEALVKDLGARVGLIRETREAQYDLFKRVNNRLDLDRTIVKLFNALRVDGNEATHEFHTTHKQALERLKDAWHLAIWYHRSFGKEGDTFKPGSFQNPEDPSTNLRSLQIQIEQLKAQLAESSQSLEDSTELAELKHKEAEEYGVLAAQMEAEAKIFEQLFYDLEAEQKASNATFEARIKALSEETERLKKEKEALQLVRQTIGKAAKRLHLTEAETRKLIDRQLVSLGWHADSEDLTFAKGARPEKGVNKAIAEWPTASGTADYVLFAGMTPLGVVEAKKRNTDVAAKLPQAERYSSTFQMRPDYLPAWQEEGRTIAWVKGESEHYHVPFVYSCNGRPYIKQYSEKSGIWFRDVRRASNIGRPLQDFHTPAGLLDLLKRDKEAAEAKLKAEGFAYLGVRDYQQRAIQAVEQTLEVGVDKALLAMATGTGKTRTIIGLIYRFLKTERFRRILFLVDRTALGNQAEDAFKEARLEQNQTLWTAYNIAELGEQAIDPETRVHVATVQAMVSRLFQSDNPLSVDTYDCIIVDEAHRGYTLDQNMTDGEAEVRDASQYLSSYRRVLDYFDAFKVGMTATPAIHTTDIFGKPVFIYSYREAVADDWLIDHEPPLTYETQLNQNGIHIPKGETVSVINAETGTIDLAELEDELDFDVDSFNRKVITPDFNRVIAEAFAQEFDPSGDAKAMVFCVNQAHAELFKTKLDEAFIAIHDEAYDQSAVQVITGQTDQVNKAISRYKNERYPTIAITVDLLTTGIDVPKICHLLFLRRVKSRVLYEQMIGRATRRCDDIGKTEFYVHDAVGIYETLEQVTSMRPLVKDPNVTLKQLIDELQNDASHAAPGSDENSSHAHDVLDQLSQKVMRILRKATNRAERNPQIKARLDELQDLWGVEPAQLHTHLHKMGPQQARRFLDTHQNLLLQLDDVKQLIGSEDRPVLYEGKDEIISVKQGYGTAEEPVDYLESFSQFIRHQLNESAALKVVCTRPKDLSREQLKEIRLLLDRNGFTEANLKAAWRHQTNQEIAASIIGYIRQAAIGEALIPFDRRVAQAMDRIYSMHAWNKLQRSWLERLAKQLSHEVVIDKQFVNKAFAVAGGASRLDKQLNGELDTILETLRDNLWQANQA